MNTLFPTNTGVNGPVKLWPNNANFVLYASFNANLVDPVKPVSAIIDLFIHSFIHLIIIIYFPVSSTVLVFGTSQRHRPPYGTRHFDFRHEVAENFEQQFPIAVTFSLVQFLWCCNYDFNV